MAKRFGGRPQGWDKARHCLPEKGDRILSPHVFTPIGGADYVWSDDGLDLTETSLTACRCGETRVETRRYNYGLDLALIEHGLGDSVKVHYVDVDEEDHRA